MDVLGLDFRHFAGLREVIEDSFSALV